MNEEYQDNHEGVTRDTNIGNEQRKNINDTKEINNHHFQTKPIETRDSTEREDNDKSKTLKRSNQIAYHLR